MTKSKRTKEKIGDPWKNRLKNRKTKQKQQQIQPSPSEKDEEQLAFCSF